MFFSIHFVCVLVYWLVVYHNDRAQHQFVFDLTRFNISALIMIISIVINTTGHASDALETILLAALAGQELIIWIVSRIFFRARFSYPIDLDLMQSRWGTWVMIVVRSMLEHSIIQFYYLFSLFRGCECC